MVSICFSIDFHIFCLLFQMLFFVRMRRKKQTVYERKTSNICVLVIGNSFEVTINTEKQKQKSWCAQDITNDYNETTCWVSHTLVERKSTSNRRRRFRRCYDHDFNHNFQRLVKCNTFNGMESNIFYHSDFPLAIFFPLVLKRLHWILVDLKKFQTMWFQFSWYRFILLPCYSIEHRLFSSCLMNISPFFLSNQISIWRLLCARFSAHYIRFGHAINSKWRNKS